MYIPYENCLFPHVFFFNSINDIEGKLYAEKLRQQNYPNYYYPKGRDSSVQMRSNERRENEFGQIGMNYLIEQSHRSHTLARHP